MEQDAYNATTETAFRLFISSTFSDMHRERDTLVNAVFPTIRRAAWARGVAFSEIDLRWGITREEAENQRTLTLCLREIERSSPFFIAILGSRYGWIDPSLENRVAELPEHLRAFADRSITELEIRHAAWLQERRAEMMPASPPIRGIVYIRGSEDSTKKAAEPDALRERLSALKRQLDDLGFETRTPYADVSMLAEQLRADLLQWLNALWPKGATSCSSDNFDQDVHLSRLTHARVDWLAVDEALRRIERRRRSRCVLYGPSGSGKSSALAAWVGNPRQSEAGIVENLLRHLFPKRTMTPTRFVYISGDTLERTSDWVPLVSRLNAALVARLQTTTKSTLKDAMVLPPANAGPDQVAAYLPIALARAAAQERTGLIIDGLDHLFDGIDEPDLDWLDFSVPSNASVTVATAQTAIRDRLVASGWDVIEVPPLDLSVREQLVTRYLATFGKQLDTIQTEAILAGPTTCSPLGLRLALSELRVFGSFEALDIEIRRINASADVVALACRLIDRTRHALKHLPDAAFTVALPALAISRAGLEEGELRQIAATDGVAMAAVHWAQVIDVLDELICFREGRIQLVSATSREAVLAAFAFDKPAIAAMRLHVAETLELVASPRRSGFEIPFQFAEANAWARLDAYLSDPCNLTELWQNSSQELAHFTTRLLKAGRTQALELAKARLKAQSQGTNQVMRIRADAALLAAGGERYAAERGLEILLAQSSEDNDSAHLFACHLDLAEFARQRGDLDRAASLLVAARQQAGSTEALAAALVRLGLVLFDAGRLTEAANAFTTALDEPPDTIGIQRRVEAQARLGLIKLKMGQRREALRSLENAASQAKRWGLSAELGVALMGLSTLEDARGHPRAAQKYLSRAEAALQRGGDLPGLIAAKHRSALISAQLGNYDDALDCLDAKILEAHAAELPYSVAIGLAARAEILRRLGARAACEADLSRATDLVKKLGPQARRDLAAAVNQVRRSLAAE